MATATKTVIFTKKISGQNIRDKKIEIQLMNVWLFQDTSYTVVASASATRMGVYLQDTFIEAGNRDRTPTGLIVVLYLLTDMNRPNYAQADDLVEVNVIAIGNV